MAVCVSYTYGEPVNGKVKTTKVCLRPAHGPPGCTTYNDTEV